MRDSDPATKKDILTAFNKINTSIRQATFKPRTFGSYIGRDIYHMVKLTTLASLVAYTVMSLSYGPIDTGKVIYSKMFYYFRRENCNAPFSNCRATIF